MSAEAPKLGKRVCARCGLLSTSALIDDKDRCRNVEMCRIRREKHLRQQEKHAKTEPVK